MEVESKNLPKKTGSVLLFLVGFAIVSITILSHVGPVKKLSHTGLILKQAPSSLNISNAGANVDFGAGGESRTPLTSLEN